MCLCLSGLISKIQPMQSLNDDERKEVLGNVLADELKAIHEYVSEIPLIKQELHQVKAITLDNNERLKVLEQVVKGHEKDLKYLKSKIA